MPRQRWVALVLALVLVAAGAVLGVLIQRTWLDHGKAATSRRGPPFGGKDRHLALMRERLELSDDQAEKLEAVLVEVRDQSEKIFDKMEPQLRAIREKSRDRVRAILRPEQLAAYDEMVAEFERRHREGRRRMRRDGPWRLGHGRGRPPDHKERFKELDSDGDGRLSRAECEASEHPFARHLLRKFDRLDSDGDGYLAPRELGP